MKTALIVILAIVVAVLVEVVTAQAGGDWITPPGGTVPPEPQPEPGSIDGDDGCPTVQIVTVYPRWYMPFVARYAELSPAAAGQLGTRP